MQRDLSREIFVENELACLQLCIFFEIFIENEIFVVA
jgi:hypothetical protein